MYNKNMFFLVCIVSGCCAFGMDPSYGERFKAGAKIFTPVVLKENYVVKTHRVQIFVEPLVPQGVVKPGRAIPGCSICKKLAGRNQSAQRSTQCFVGRFNVKRRGAHFFMPYVQKKTESKKEIMDFLARRDGYDLNETDTLVLKFLSYDIQQRKGNVYFKHVD